MDRIDILKRIPLFASVDALDKYVARRSIYWNRYSKGETVYHCGDSCTTLDVVQSGELVAYSLAENGSEAAMFEFKPGNMLGANLLFAEKNTYPLNIYCLSDCVLVHVDRETVSELLHHYDFVMQYIKSLSQNSQSMNNKLGLFFQKTLRENIMDYLAMQSVMQKSNRIVLPTSKKELADYLCVQRPSLFRELKKMKDEGMIEIQNRTVTILE